METHLQNPFINFGKPSDLGDRFIGRKTHIWKIEDKIVAPEEPGNLSIVGMRRIGKTTLIHHVLTKFKRRLLSKNVLPIYIDLGPYHDVIEMFDDIIEEILEEMEEMKWLTKSLREKGILALEEKTIWQIKFNKIKSFLKEMKKSGFRLLLILDEFDNVVQIFKGSVPEFQKLRVLTDSVKVDVIYLTASRRKITEIERQLGCVSNLEDRMDKHALSMFDEEDMEEYYQKFTNIGINLSDKIKNKLVSQCYRHPFLLAMFGCRIIEIYQRKKEIDFDEIMLSVEESLVNHFNKVNNVLKEEGNYLKLLEVLGFGPRIHVTQYDANQFLRYGLIKEVKDENNIIFKSYSDYFNTYLGMLSRNLDLWPTWRDTETGMRLMIENIMNCTYGPKWISKMENTFPSLKTKFRKSRENREKEVSGFKGSASLNLLDYTYPDDLFEIISLQYDIFKPIFLNKNISYWKPHRELINKVRNSLAHNRIESLNYYDKEKVSGYLGEILDTITGVNVIFESLSKETLKVVSDAVKEKKIERSNIFEVIEIAFQGNNISNIDELINILKEPQEELDKLSIDETIEIIEEILESSKDLVLTKGVNAFNLLMGKLKKETRRRVDDKTVVSLLRKKLEEFLRNLDTN